MGPYDEEIQKFIAVKRTSIGGVDPQAIESRYPSEMDGLLVGCPCPRCRGSVLPDDGDLVCLACGCRVCPECGQALVAGMCEKCDGGPLPLRYRVGPQ